MRVTAKICGLTSAGDARAALDAGADFLGFVFFPGSPRCLPVDAAAWVREIRGVPRVGVFRNQDEAFVARLAAEANLDLIQLHGHEAPGMCARLGGRAHVIKAIPVGDTVDRDLVEEYASVARILFDTASAAGGGTGRSFDWALLSPGARPGGFWLAGGLRTENVGAAIAALRPAGVDVASGVESIVGRKDPARMRAFVAAVQAAEVETARRDARDP